MTMTAAEVKARGNLKRVSRARLDLVKAQAALRETILTAHANGQTLAEIGQAAGLTPQRIHQLTRDQ